MNPRNGSQSSASLAPLEPSLFGRSFQSLLWTNWLTVINDNVFRWLVIGIGKDYFPESQHTQVLTWGLVCFVLPYILFAAPAGFLADRFSKSRVVISCKFLEIAVMILGSFAIFAESFPLLLISVFLMGTQSALFSPSKIGMIPELVGPDKISAANGYFNLGTLTATIIGAAIGGWLSDVTGYRGLETNAALSPIVTIGLAGVGTIISLLMIRTPVANPRATFPWTLVGEVFRDIRILASKQSLLVVALGVIYFWAIGALFQLNVDPFSTQSGGITESHRTPLLISLVLGVGIGSVLAGFFSSGRIELGLVPWGAMGLSIFCAWLFFTPAQFIGFDSQSLLNLVYVCGLLALLGISSGFFDVPLESYLQQRSPPEKRGAILSAVNCLMFSAMMVVSIIFGTLTASFFQPNFDYLPPRYQISSLTAGEQLAFTQSIDAFERNLEPQSNDPKTGYKPANLVADHVKLIADDELRQVVLARLVWDQLDQQSELTDSGTQLLKMEDFRHEFDGRAELPELQTVSEVFRQHAGLPLVSSRGMFLLIGIVTIPIVLFSAYRLQKAMVRIVCWWIARCLYRIKVCGLDNIPANGGAILVSNHISLFDGALFLVMTSRRTRMLAWAGNFRNPIGKFMANFTETILITGGPKSIQQGLAEARKSLNQGALVGIFPEGGLSRTGSVQAFKPGLMKILEHAHVPIVPVYIDEMWGSNLSEARKGIFHWPEKWRRQMTVHIGKPFLRSKSEFPNSVHPVRQEVLKLGATAMPHRQSPFVSPAQKFIRSAKQRKFKLMLGCSTGQEATGGALLMRTLILRRLLNRHVLDSREQEPTVGVLLPPSFGGVAVNLALGLDRRIAVNLNYTVSSEILNKCVQVAGIDKLLTSKKVWEKFDYQLDCDVVFIDDLREQVTSADKAVCGFQAFAMPAAILERSLGLNNQDPDDTLTIIFTSGSTGTPKGVELTLRNVASNVEAIGQVIALTPSDVMVGVLPFFHSFGYTVTLWGAMGLNVAGVYHFNPLDARQIGKLTQKYKGTVLLGTPTFLRSYVKRVSKVEFSSVDTVVAGAERLPKDMCDSFENKFGVRPVEGYGVTELSPLVSVNIPPSRSRDNFQVDCREGTVGRPIPNVAAKITDLDDDSRELDCGQPGMLWISGPNVMKCYRNQPEATAEVVRDGWYKTGDVALIDAEGFIQITGRMSRFSKIGGEMVPHVKIEEALNHYVGADEDEDGEIDEMKMAVTAVPDSKKGERLVVLHTAIKQQPDELCKQLSGDGFPNIYIPSTDSFLQIDQLPMLGSGKLDLKQLKEIARQHYAPQSE